MGQQCPWSLFHFGKINVHRGLAILVTIVSIVIYIFCDNKSKYRLGLSGDISVHSFFHSGDNKFIDVWSF